MIGWLVVSCLRGVIWEGFEQNGQFTCRACVSDSRIMKTEGILSLSISVVGISSTALKNVKGRTCGATYIALLSDLWLVGICSIECSVLYLPFRVAHRGARIPPHRISPFHWRCVLRKRLCSYCASAVQPNGPSTAIRSNWQSNGISLDSSGNTFCPWTIHPGVPCLRLYVSTESGRSEPLASLTVMTIVIYCSYSLREKNIRLREPDGCKKIEGASLRRCFSSEPLCGNIG